jgi:mono/diheme cytochrome c family protein/rhodanese-related sulfurtransferase
MRLMFHRSRLLPLFVLLAACGGGKESPKDGAPAAAVDARRPNARLEEGAKLWKTYCALCHGPEAKGYVADNAPSLVTPSFLATVTDVFLRGSIAHGRPGTAMAAYGKELGGPLTDDDILKIVAWVRSLHTIDRVKPEPPRKGDATRGKAVYDATCKACHGDADTRGPHVWLANGKFLELASDAFIRHAIVHGRAGTLMNAFGGALSDTQIDDIVALIRSWAQPATTPPPDPHAGHDHGHGHSHEAPSLEGMDLVINPDGKHAKLTLREDRFVPSAQVAKALEEKRRMIIVDARAASDWKMMRIPGSIPVPYYKMDELAKLPNDGTWILAYCACPHHASGVVVDELRKRGYKNTAVIDEGILHWQQQGYPVEGAAMPKVPKGP